MINMYIHCVVPCVITQDIYHTYVHPLCGSISMFLSLIHVHHKDYFIIIVCVLCIVTRWIVVIHCVISRYKLSISFNTDCIVTRWIVIIHCVISTYLCTSTVWFHKYVLVSNTRTSQRLVHCNHLCSVYCHTVNSDNSVCDTETMPRS